MRRGAVVACLIIALAGLPAAAAEFDTVDWYQGADGFERALEEAKRHQKPMMVYFRTDWCPYCKQFEQELLSAKTVKSYFADVVKVTINPETGREENRLASTYGVRGFPAIFMHPVDGQPRRVRRTVMRDGRVGLQTAEEFVATLSQAVTE